jgi:hypothetical protein
LLEKYSVDKIIAENNKLLPELTAYWYSPEPTIEIVVKLSDAVPK